MATEPAEPAVPRARIALAPPDEAHDLTDELSPDQILDLIDTRSAEPPRPRDPIAECGLAGLAVGADVIDAGECLRRLGAGLNGTDPVGREVIRVRAIRELERAGITPAARMVDAALPRPAANGEGAAAPGTAITFKDVEAWPEPVDGAGLLDAIRTIIQHYVACVPGAADTLAVFALVSHAITAFDVAPYVFLTSPTPECGKTRLLEVLELVVWRPWRPAILTGPVLFRGIEQHQPTTLLDEAEVVKGRGEAADNVRAILHVGYRRGGHVERCVGENLELRAFGVFGPKVFAAIGELPPTLLSRCIVIPMRRRTTAETVARFFHHPGLAQRRDELQRQCRRWAQDNVAALRGTEVTLPPGLEDRQAEVWGPLFAVAALAGAGWQAKIEAAATALGAGRESDTAGIQLLLDVAEVFAERGADRLASEDIIAVLVKMEDRPWPEWRQGHPLTVHQLARLLAPFGVHPKQLWHDGRKIRGYDLADFSDAFARYTPPIPAPEPVGTVERRGDATSRPSAIRYDGAPLPIHESPENPHGASTLPGLPVQRTGRPVCGLGHPATAWWTDASGNPVCGICHPRPVPSATAPPDATPSSAPAPAPAWAASAVLRTLAARHADPRVRDSAQRRLTTYDHNDAGPTAPVVHHPSREG